MEQSLELIRAFWPIFAAIITILFFGLVWALRRDHNINTQGEKISLIANDLKTLKENDLKEMREKHDADLEVLRLKHDQDLKAVYDRINSNDEKMSKEISSINTFMAELRGYLYGSSRKRTNRK